MNIKYERVNPDSCIIKSCIVKKTVAARLDFVRYGFFRRIGP